MAFGGLKKWLKDRAGNVASVASRGFDQVNVFDSGRSFTTRTPIENKSVKQNFGDIKRNVVDPVATQASRAAFVISQSPVGQAMGQPNYNRLNQQMSDRIRQTHGPDMAQAFDTRMNQWTLDRYGVNANDSKLAAAGKVAANVYGTAANFVPVASGAQVLKAGVRPGIKMINNAGMAGAVGNATAAVGEGANLKDVTKSAAIGYGFGAAMPVGGAVIRTAAKPVIRTAQNQAAQRAFTKAAQNLTPEDRAIYEGIYRMHSNPNSVPVQQRNFLIAAGRQLDQKYGIDSTVSGSRAEFKQRIENLIDESMKPRRRSVLSDEMGAVGRNIRQDDPLEALKAEARKYGSAEEFISASRNITDFDRDAARTIFKNVKPGDGEAGVIKALSDLYNQATAPQVGKTPLKLTEEQYLASKGAGFMEGSEPALHRQPNVSEKTHKRNVAKVSEDMNANLNRRAELRKEYQQKLGSGEVVTPTREEQIIARANGHPDLESTKASRRLAEKYGIEWRKPDASQGGKIPAITDQQIQSMNPYNIDRTKLSGRQLDMPNRVLSGEDPIPSTTQSARKLQSTKNIQNPTPPREPVAPQQTRMVQNTPKGLENKSSTPFADSVAQNLKDSIKSKRGKEIFDQHTADYLNTVNAARVDASRRMVDFEAKHKLSPEQQMEVIRNADNPRLGSKDPAVKSAVKDLQKIYNDAWNYFTKEKGLEMGFQHDYYPRMYKNKVTGEEITAMEYDFLQRKSGRQKSRTSDTLNEFELVTKNPAEALKKYYNSLERVAAGRKYLNALEQEGLVVKSMDGSDVRGRRPVIAEGLQPPGGGLYYANKDVASKLNTIFGSREATNLLEKAFEKAQGVNSLFQSVVLSGGIPNTPINAFGMMQVMKEVMTLHPIKAAKASWAGVNKDFAKKFFVGKADTLKLMAENGVDVRVDLTDIVKTGRQRTKAAFSTSKAKGLNQAWDEVTNDATFGRFMPMLEVQHFENVYKHGLKKNLSPERAAKIAAESTKNFYGKTSVVKQATRAKVVDDAAGAFLFAPRFRESMVNFWIKNAKSLDPRGNFKNLRSVEYRDNAKFMAAAALMYAGYDAVNVALNDQHLWENPDGKKDKLLIPNGSSDGKTLGIPFLPSIATVPRNAAGLVANTLTGRLEEAGKNLRSFASGPLALGGELLTNEDYFGRKIYDQEDSGGTRVAKTASHIAKGTMQPWAREGLNIAGQNLPEGTKKALGIKEKSGFETAANALEAPIRFYDPAYMRGGKNPTPKKMTKDQQEKYEALPDSAKADFELALKEGRVKNDGSVTTAKDDAVGQARNAILRTKAKLPSNISKESEKILTRYARLSSKGKEKFNTDPVKKRQLAEAKIERDFLLGKLTQEEAIAKLNKLDGKKTTKTKGRSGSRGGSKTALKTAISYAKSGGDNQPVLKVSSGSAPSGKLSIPAIRTSARSARGKTYRTTAKKIARA